MEKMILWDIKAVHRNRSKPVEVRSKLEVSSVLQVMH